MAKKEKKGGHDRGTEGFEVDLGGVLRGLGDFVELIGKVAEADENRVERHGEFRVKGLGDQARGVYGFSIRTGLGGTTRVEPFGNVHKDKEGLTVDEVREPLVDVFDEGDEIVITAELPGASEDEITVDFHGDVVTIEASGHRPYAKETLLPCQVRSDDFRQSYNNGVLEIRAKKA